MNSFNLFINTKIENSGFFASVGDFALSPIRYFFHGRTVQIMRVHGEKHVSHFASYKVNPKYYGLSSSKGHIKTVAMIISLVPGVLIGTVAKGVAYLTSVEMKSNRDLAEKHLTPIDFTIGSLHDRKTSAEIQQTINDLNKDPLGRKINLLTIYGKEVAFERDPGFVRLNPKKVILIGFNEQKIENLISNILTNPKWHHTYGSLEEFLFKKKTEEAPDRRVKAYNSWSYKKHNTLYLLKSTLPMNE